ncbi:MAG: TetR/AcrR family transcriptional regulator [Christensenellaceae bacterium]
MKKRVITKELILRSAMDFVIEHGIDELNSRSLSKKMKCSTQPIYLSFTNMEDLKSQLLLESRAFSENYILSGLNDDDSIFLGYVSSYIKFAYEYPKLYEFIFLKMKNYESESTKAYNEEIIKGIMVAGNYTHEVAEKFFIQSFIFAHGLATQIVTGFINWNFDVIYELLTDQFEALKLKYKGNR